MNDEKKHQPAPSLVKPDYPVYRSEALFTRGKVIVIVHQGREYQLRVTSGNKLILTA